MDTEAAAEVIPTNSEHSLGFGARTLLGGVFAALAIAGCASADSEETAQISPHPCIDEFVAVLVPGHVEGTADMTSELQAALADGPISLSGEITDDIFSSENGLVIEIQRGTVACGVDGGY